MHRFSWSDRQARADNIDYTNGPIRTDPETTVYVIPSRPVSWFPERSGNGHGRGRRNTQNGLRGFVATTSLRCSTSRSIPLAAFPEAAGGGRRPERRAGRLYHAGRVCA